MNVSWAPLEDNDGEVQMHQMGQQSTPVFEMSQCHPFLRSDGTTTGLHQCLTGKAGGRFPQFPQFPQCEMLSQDLT